MEDALEPLEMGFFEAMRRLHQVKPTLFEQFDGVTPTEARALLMIRVAERCQPEGCAARPGCVAERMHVTRSALSQLLKSLERKGLVVRSRGEQDCRAVTLQLSREGARIASLVEDQWEKEARALVEYVGVEDFRRLLATVNRIVDFHEQMRVCRAHAGVSSAADASAPEDVAISVVPASKDAVVFAALAPEAPAGGEGSCA